MRRPERTFVGDTQIRFLRIQIVTWLLRQPNANAERRLRLLRAVEILPAGDVSRFYQGQFDLSARYRQRPLNFFNSVLISGSDWLDVLGDERFVKAQQLITEQHGEVMGGLAAH